MDRKTQLDQWWDRLGETEQKQLLERGRLTGEQRASLARAGLLDKDKPDDEGEIIAQLKSRH